MNKWRGSLIRRVFRTLSLLMSLTALAGGCRGDYGGLGGDASVTTSGDFLSSGRTESFFTAIQVDPRSEDSAGPQFVVAEDLDGDGLLDLVSAWNQSQPVQLHLQRRGTSGEISFETVTLAGNTPVVVVAGLAVADFDRDGRMDIAVLLKQTLLPDAGCLDSEAPDEEGLSGLILIYLGPSEAAQTDQALAWGEAHVEASRLQGKGDTTGPPEVGGFTSMAVGDIDLDGDLDIVTAWNSNCGGEGGTTDALIFTNQGVAAVRDGTWSTARIPNMVPIGTHIKDVALGDIDLDGDLDVVATFPDAASMNVRWFRNPVIDAPDSFHVADRLWQVGVVGQVSTQADIVRLGDIDGDGRLDVVVRSSGGRLIQWLKGPGEASTSVSVGNIPWQVFTIAEFTERIPEALALGDLNFDGQLELIAAAEGGLAWFDPLGPATIFDQWTERLIIDDNSSSGGGSVTTDPGVDPDDLVGSTKINSIQVVDLDGDGANDLVVTLDRSGLSGLSNDALVWFRNTRRPPG